MKLEKFHRSLQKKLFLTFGDSTFSTFMDILKVYSKTSENKLFFIQTICYNEAIFYQRDVGCCRVDQSKSLEEVLTSNDFNSFLGADLVTNCIL
jgi:hypothetical protein